MAECLLCLGEGLHDYRDDNARLAEQLTDDELVAVRQTSAWITPIQPCMECEGTGVISDERYEQMVTAAQAAIVQAMRDHGLIPQEETTA